MKWSVKIALLAVFMAGLSPGCRAQSGASQYDLAPRQRSSTGRDSFLDFTLARFNPTNSDYGECLSEGRRALLDDTVQNVYFWSNVIALASLACLLLVFAHQHRGQAKREWATAELLAQFEHALARSRAQLSAASRSNHELANELAVSRESAERYIPRPSEPVERIVASSPKIRATTANNTPPAIPSVKHAVVDGRQSVAAGNTTLPVDQMRLFTPDVDLVMKINSLEQQLAQSHRDNTALRRQIGDSDRRLEPGARRNRQVKEA